MSDLRNVSLTAIQGELLGRGYVAVPIGDLTDAQLAILRQRWQQEAKRDLAHANELERFGGQES